MNGAGDLPGGAMAAVAGVWRMVGLIWVTRWQRTRHARRPMGLNSEPVKKFAVTNDSIHNVACLSTPLDTNPIDWYTDNNVRRASELLVGECQTLRRRR